MATIRMPGSAALAALGALLLVLVACGEPAATGNPVGDAAPSITMSRLEPSRPETTSAATVTTSTAAPTQSAPATVLYRADWSAGLDGWSGSKDWTALGGKLLCAGKDFSHTAGAVAPIDLDGVGSFAVEAEIQLLRYSITNGSFGVMVRVQEDGNGYSAGHHPADEEVVLRTALGSAPDLDSQPFTPGEEWHRYRVEVSDNELRVLLDGAPVLSATDNTFLTGKRVGLWSSGAQLSVRSFEVTELRG